MRTYLDIWIYIYMYREREGQCERERYIYIYIHILMDNTDPARRYVPSTLASNYGIYLEIMVS